MLVLGIESSCDETALALVRDGALVDAVLASQADIHALFGGVVPELASREHLRYMGALFDELMRRQNLSPAGIDCVAVSRGPGLLGSLLGGGGAANAQQAAQPLTVEQPAQQPAQQSGKPTGLLGKLFGLLK